MPDVLSFMAAGEQRATFKVFQKRKYIFMIKSFVSAYVCKVSKWFLRFINRNVNFLFLLLLTAACCLDLSSRTTLNLISYSFVFLCLFTFELKFA